MQTVREKTMPEDQHVPIWNKDKSADMFYLRVLKSFL
jgi:hypothetical protein